MQRSEIARRLTRIIEAQLGQEDQGPIPDESRDLVGLGVGSLALFDVALDVDLAFRISLEEEDLATARTVGDFVDLIARKRSTA